MNPNIAIISAAYNWKKFLHQYINSITKQTYKNFVVYLCDDCSSDGSVDELKANYDVCFADQDGYHADKGMFEVGQTTFHLLINGVNKRQGYARNRAIKEASKFNAEAFAIHDVDDYWYPNFLARHVEEWQKDPSQIGLVYSDYRINDVKNNLLIDEYKQSYSYEELHRHCISSSNCLISRVALEKCGLYDEEISPVEDYLMSLKISNFFTEVHIPEFLWEYNLHGENCTVRELERHKQMFPIMGHKYQEWRSKLQ